MLSSANLTIARNFARECQLSYGLSSFNGRYYVGTPSALASIGVFDIKNYWES